MCKRCCCNMDSVLAKAGSYLFTKRANKELDSFGNDVNVSFLASSLTVFFWSSFSDSFSSFLSNFMWESLAELYDLGDLTELLTEPVKDDRSDRLVSRRWPDWNCLLGFQSL